LLLRNGFSHGNSHAIAQDGRVNRLDDLSDPVTPTPAGWITTWTRRQGGSV
jgi:hypothetical protein